MAKLTLAPRLRAGETLFSGWCDSGQPVVAQTLALAGFPTVILDMQHGPYDVITAMAGIAGVVQFGASACVRIPVGEMQTASRALDCGAEAVIAPMINTAADARAFASFMKYPPVGERSWGPFAAMRLFEFDGAASVARGADTLAFVMIETKAALDALDEIVGVEGIDGVFVGPGDLSIALTGKLDPHCAVIDEALAKILAACKRHNKIPGVYCATGARAKDLAARGFRYLAVSTGLAMMTIGAKAELAATK